MTYLQRAERVIRNCYMGEFPQDPFILLLQGVIAKEIEDAVNERGKGE